MSYVVKICLLLSFFAFTHAHRTYGVKAIEETFCNQIDSLQTSFELGKRFFRTSVYDSVSRIREAQNPIQADLYILAHYLMYQDELRFESDPNKAVELRNQIASYLLNKENSDAWLKEGCLATKVFIGLRQYESFYQPEMVGLVNAYAHFILDRWKGHGVGECFSPDIERTYGVSFSTEQCTPPTTELNAKVAFYLSLLTKDEVEPFIQLNLSALNNMNEDPLSGWWDIVAELWVIKVYRQPENRFISAERFEVAKNKFAAALRSANPNDPQTIRDSLLVYGGLLAGLPLDQKMVELIHAVRSLQTKDGRLPSHFKINAQLKGHNIDATPTYFYLLAVQTIFHYQNWHVQCAR